jgi:CRISPR/Cas system CSM-associated protein Csm3 (group 7 of RAMP superfamily)
MNAPTFENRWLIVGTLTTESELHIGDGGSGALHDRGRPADEKRDETDASTVCTDHRRRAYVPGSAIKGPLRALVTTSSGSIAPEWEQLLGSDKPDDIASVGGKLEFWDAFHAGGNGTEEEEPNPKELHLNPDRNRPWWSNTRKTCVAVAVSLDRRTRTAKKNLLYHLEYVPKGETFRFEVSSDNISAKEVAQLLLLLDQFNSLAANRAMLGALVSNDWGRVVCAVNEIRRLDASSIGAWKANPSVGLNALPRIEPDLQQKIEQEKAGLKLPDTSGELVIKLSLSMESPWLIRDPRQRERSEHSKVLAEHEKPKDAIAIQDESGTAFVPAKSLRGALRARAEVILRTLGLACADHPAEIEAVSTKGSSAADAVQKVATLDLAARLFGLSGWRAPLHVTRFVANGHPTKHEQEFVAIDRFTGGAAGGAKFNAELAGIANLTGTLTVDMRRLGRVDTELASIGLLALVLRDLAEGDIPIGSGSAKGQGVCTADVSITGSPDWRTDPKVVKGLAALRALPHAGESEVPK